MRLLIIDYGMGNLGSVKRSFEECGANVLVSDRPQDLENASKVVLPGVGAFADGMKQLQACGWVPFIRRAVCEQQIPFLGICLGMQLLADRGYEGGEIQGLSIIQGETIRLLPESAMDRVPHVGWNEVHVTNNNQLFHGIPNRSDFYFVHSYHFVPENPEHIIAKTPYCGGFVSALKFNYVFGVQFHPEKSSRVGFQLIKNFLSF